MTIITIVGSVDSVELHNITVSIYLTCMYVYVIVTLGCLVASLTVDEYHVIITVAVRSL